MLGLMQEWPLTVDRIISHASERHGGREVVWRGDEEVHRTDYRQICLRARQVSHGLLEMGLAPGDRVATLAWNDALHIEIWYGTMGIGCVCHTLNPRFHPDQLAWAIDHADDRVIFVAADLLGLLNTALTKTQRAHPIVIVLAATTVAVSIGDRISSDQWISGRPARLEDGAPAWGRFSEATACGLCYTSGTTGDPKGVLYSHRSNFLHSLITLQGDVFGLSAADVVMPIVPLFHANAWGLVFSAPAVGAKLALPGRALDPLSLHRMILSEGVTFAAGVPTVWQGLLQHVRATGQTLGTLKRVVIGGSACSEPMLREFHALGVEVRHAWGMTEVSPLGTTSTPPSRLAQSSFEDQVAFRMKQGRPPLGVEIAIIDAAGRRIVEDGTAAGRLVVRGPTVASAYFGTDHSVEDDDGFFDTGDVATIDPDGGMQITDRAKDVIKSGGEWISSLAIENIAAGHPNVLCAAAIGVPDPRWDERPLLLVQPYVGDDHLIEELTQLLADRLPKWWIPKIMLVESIPLGVTGKVDKIRLRSLYAEG